MPTMQNTAVVNAEQNQQPLVADSTIELQLPAISVIKSTDKPVWTDSEATFFVEVRNIEETGDVVENVRFTDVIDPRYATLIAGTVMVNSVLLPEGDYTYDEITGELAFNLPDLQATESHSISFRVRKV